jgi:cytochrome bd-type quinol oxidase subunit 2
MKSRLLFFIFLGINCTIQAQEKNPVLQSAQNFTRLMILSFVIIVALWALVWFRRKRK